jgi:multidrug efflux pump subunit AcrA (membrane-fusion protein)
MKFILKKTVLIPLIIIIIIVTIVIFNFNKKDEVEYVTAKAETGDLIQTVSETGTVKANKEIELNFLQTGKINKINVNTGDQVKKGQILAELDYEALNIRKQEAEASLEIAKSNLIKLLQGVTGSQIAVSEANVNKAEASYNSAIGELSKIQKTVTENILQSQKTLNDLISDGEGNITPYEQAVITAQVNLDNAKSTYQKSINDYEESLISVVESKLSVANSALDSINTIITDDTAESYLSVKYITHRNDMEYSYEQAQEFYNIARNNLEIAKNNTTENNIKNMLTSILECINETLESLNYAYNALENSVTSTEFTQASLDAYKTTINTQIVNINIAISSIQTADQNLSNANLSYDTNIYSKEDGLNKAKVDLDNAIIVARNVLSSAEVSGDQQITSVESQVNASKEVWDVSIAQLVELKSPPRSEDISLYRAQVKQAEASFDLILKQIDDSIIKASIDGTITDIEYEVGEQVNSSKSAVKMLGENNFEIEVDISEADIAKISVNNPVEITLDAFGDDVHFFGKVYFIEPAETVIQEVIYYKLKIVFNENEFDLTNIKSGMTANVIITTNEKKNVLLVPGRSIIEKNGSGKFIRILKDNILEEVSVKIGIKGDEGQTEVLNGIKAGDEVITYIREPK